MRNLTLRQIRIFLSASKHLSFAKAAEELHVSPAAISLQIKEMESDIGVSLFTRNNRKVTPSQAGEYFLPYAQRILRALSEANDMFDELRDTEMSVLKIGLVSTTRYFFPLLLVAFKQNYPNIQIKVEVKNRQQLVELLRAGEIDIAIMGKPPSDIEALAEPFSNHPHGFIASPIHPLAGKEKLPANLLNQLEIITRESGSGTRYIMEKYLSQHGLSPVVRMEMSGNETIKQAVIADLGVSFVSLHTIRNELTNKQIVVLDITDTPVNRTWHVVSPKNHQNRLAIKAFRTFMLDKAEGILRDVFLNAPYTQQEQEVNT